MADAKFLDGSERVSRVLGLYVQAFRAFGLSDSRAWRFRFK